MTAAIETSGLGKRYALRHQAREPYVALRDVVTQAVRDLPRRIRRGGRSDGSRVTQEDFWALRNVNLVVDQGERIGIIGRNGAGKSTLLKLLSRITEPTLGTIRIRGRIASMLEVGTGFHPELTGRENIFLNGAILGMRRAEIVRKFDEIVAFAEVERFLDTPAKRYSTGMYLRLAFAVAAHLEPEILVVDEVLAVGDAAFQKKCLGRMQQAGKEGRTVLFVSHNMAAIETLCSRALVLDQGRVSSQGDVASQIALYLGTAGASRSSLASPVAVGAVRVEQLVFSPNPVESWSGTNFRLELAAAQDTRIDAAAILLLSDLGARVAIVDLRRAQPYHVGATRRLVLSGRIDAIPLVEGDYAIGLYLKTASGETNLQDLVTLQVAAMPTTGDVVPYSPRVRGVTQLRSHFVVETE